MARKAEDANQEGGCIIKKAFKFEETLKTKKRKVLPQSSGELGKVRKNLHQTLWLSSEVMSIMRGFGGNWEQPSSDVCNTGHNRQREIQILQRWGENKTSDCTMGFIHELTKLLPLPQ